MKPVHPAIPADGAAEQAAQAIVELINAQPRSPRPDEIAAIIRKVAVPPARPATCPHCDDAYREYGPAIRPQP
jgi:hypothetical protein